MNKYIKEYTGDKNLSKNFINVRNINVTFHEFKVIASIYLH